jgi:exodeoxyribonuclease-5
MPKEILDYLHFHTATEEQKNVLSALADFVNDENDEDFFVLCGAAGTGKTSITSALIGYLNEGEVRYKIAAPTGRAARILGKKTKTISNTIHSLIYTAESNKETGVLNWKLKKNVHKDYTVFIIDESSMIKSNNDSDRNPMFKSDDSVLNHLIHYIKEGNIKNKVVFLGDKNQLPPYEEEVANALNPIFLRSHYNLIGNFHYLTEVKRVEDGSYILKNAIEIRQSIDIPSINIPIIEGADLKNIWKAAADYVINYDENNTDKSVAIARSNVSNDRFNKEVRKLLFGTDTKLVENGDLLIVLNNWKRNDKILYNGDHILIEYANIREMETVANLHFLPVKIKASKIDGSIEVIEDYIMLDTLLTFDGKVSPQMETSLRAERFRKNKVYGDTCIAEDDKYVGAIKVGYGYSITCQKAQGGEWDNVYINMFGIKDKKWLYTAVTRAKKELKLY